MENLAIGQFLTNRFTGKARKIVDVEVSGGLTIAIQLDNGKWLQTYNLTNFKLLNPEGQEIKEYGRKHDVPESGKRGSSVAGRSTADRTAHTVGIRGRKKSK